MAKNVIKSPAEDIVGAKPAGKATRGGVFNGEEPGYQKRTPSKNAMPERTYDAPYPKGNLSVKTPADRAGKA